MGFGACVNIHVVVEGSLIDEALAAHLANEGLLGVWCVVLQLVCLVECGLDLLSTFFTRRERVARVQVLLVYLFMLEHLVAVFTVDLFVPVLPAHVFR